MKIMFIINKKIKQQKKNLLIKKYHKIQKIIFNKILNLNIKR